MATAQEVGKLIARGIGPVAKAINPHGAGGALRQLLEVAIDGRGRLPSAKSAASRHLQRHGGSVDLAIQSLVDYHVRPGFGAGIRHEHRRTGLASGRNPGQYHRNRRGPGPDGRRDRPPAWL